MPIFEYICLDCNLKFDYLLRSNQEQVSCPKCNYKDLKRLVSMFAFNAKDTQGNITSSSAGCAGCTSQNCSSCSR